MTSVSRSLSFKAHTYINGNTITTGKIKSIDGNNYFDLTQNKFKLGDASHSIDWNVTTAGALTIKGAVVSDLILAAYATIDNLKVEKFEGVPLYTADSYIKIENNEIWEDSANGPSVSYTNINLHGYNHGDSVGKNTIIGDGQGNRVIGVLNGNIVMYNRVKIGGGAYANNYAILDLESTTKGFLIPRMTTTARDAISGVDGMMIFNITTHQPNFYCQSQWWNMSLS